MHHLSYAEFYITNVCNLNCDNCNRYNNFAFTGHQSWDEYAKLYAEWAKIIDIEMICILGGEPLLNPDFIKWISGISSLWPNSFIRISTNGTQLDRWPELYDILEKSEGRIYLEVNQHGVDLEDTVEKNVRSFLKGQLTTSFTTNWQWRRRWQEQWASIRDASWPDIDDPEQFNTLPPHIQEEFKRCCPDFDPATFKETHGNKHCSPSVKSDSIPLQDDHGVIIEKQMSNIFMDIALVFDPASKKLSLHDSVPQEAMDVCGFRICHVFSRGQLHKCGPVHVLPEFIQQFPVDISAADRVLINSYKPAAPDWGYGKLDTFLNGLKNGDAIPQCKFCPSSKKNKKINSGYKKVKITKIKG
jgi:hypothetical protein